MDAGAALRARAISASRSAIKYWSSGAMVGYCVLASSAHACREAPEKQLRTKISEATANPNRLIEYSCKALQSVQSLEAACHIVRSSHEAKTDRTGARRGCRPGRGGRNRPFPLWPLGAA